ncbi:unnamed protein product, partial [Mesorhabditis spiculigera]
MEIGLDLDWIGLDDGDQFYLRNVETQEKISLNLDPSKNITVDFPPNKEYQLYFVDIPRASNVKRGDALSSSLMGLNLHEEAERLLQKDFTSEPYIAHHMDRFLDLIANDPNGDQFLSQYGHLPFIESAGPRSWRTCYYAGYDIGEYKQAKSQHPSGMTLFRCVSTKKKGQQDVDMVRFGLVTEVLSSLTIFDENGNEQPHHIGCLDFYVIKTWIGDLEVLLCVQGDGFVRSDDGRHQIVELKCCKHKKKPQPGKTNKTKLRNKWAGYDWSFLTLTIVSHRKGIVTEVDEEYLEKASADSAKGKQQEADQIYANYIRLKML